VCAYVLVLEDSKVQTKSETVPMRLPTGS